MFYFASQQRIANISENFTCTVLPNFVLCSHFSEAQRRPDLLSSNPTGVGVRHNANMLQCVQNYIIVLIICIFFLTFLEPLIHDSKYGNKRYNNNAICLVNLNKRAKLILPNRLVD